MSEYKQKKFIDYIVKHQKRKLIEKFIKELHPYRYVRLLGESKTMGDIIKKWKENKNEL